MGGVKILSSMWSKFCRKSFLEPAVATTHSLPSYIVE
jgi:hypothetical protein